MTRSLEELVNRLELFLPALREVRAADAFANDMFEAVDDLIHLGHLIVTGDTRTNYPFRVRQEKDLWTKLNLLRHTRAADLRGYDQIFDLSGQILLIADTVETPPDGHLEFLKAVREHFAFVQSEYGLKAVHEEPITIRYTSGAVMGRTCMGHKCQFVMFIRLRGESRRDVLDRRPSVSLWR